MTVGVLLGVFMSVMLPGAFSSDGANWQNVLLAAVTILLVASGIAMLKASWRPWAGRFLVLMGLCGLAALVSIFQFHELSAGALRSERGRFVTLSYVLFAAYPVYGFGVGLPMLLASRRAADRGGDR